MTRPTAIFRSICSRLARGARTCCLLLLAGWMGLPAVLPVAVVLVSPAFAAGQPTGQATVQATGQPTVQAGTVQNAINNTDYAYSSGLRGLQVMNNTHDFSITAWTVCRYLDVGTVPGGNGLLIPFNTAGEWIGSSGTNAPKGFLATNAMRTSFVTLDFCRPAKTLTANFAGPGGISDPSSLVAGQQTIVSYSFPQKRVETRYTDTQFVQSLTEQAAQSLNLSRADCLGNTTYPDGSVRNPCFTWSWVEQITATFTDNIGNTRPQAALAAKGTGDVTHNWGTTLARTACIGPNGVANDGRVVPTNTCPPAVQPPVLRSCPPQDHNTKHWATVSTGNVRFLHDCGAGYIEDPARRYTYDLQAEYWCFDSTDYPTGNTRESNGVTSGLCKPIIPGQAGPVNGTSQDSLTAGTPGLCSVGAVSAFAVTATGWSWSCQGQNTGADAYGTANQHMNYNLACHAADASLGGAGQVSFTCDKFNGSSMTCAGTQTWTGASGCCVAGQTNNQSFNVNGYTMTGCDTPAPTNVYAFGDNGSGQLGNGTTTSSGNSPSTYVPVNVLGGGTYTSVSASGNASAGIKTDGTLAVFGNGQTLPMQSGTATNIATAVGAGDKLTVLTTGNKVYVGTAQQTQVSGDWKMVSATSGTMNLVAALDTGGNGNSSLPAAVAVNTCGIRSDNTAWCWMTAGNGASNFVQLPGADYMSIVIGNGVVAVIKVDGSLFVGVNNAQLSQAPGSNYTSVVIGDGEKVLAIREPNELFSAIIMQQENGDGKPTTQFTDAKTASGTFIAVAATNGTGCALSNTGAVFCFSDISAMTQLPGGKVFSSIVAGDGHYLAIEGTPVCLQVIETRNTTACPQGQNGTITEQRTKNTSAVCGAYSAWAQTSNTCVANATYHWDASVWQAGSCQ